eukprot:3280586-Rhodomonas_salina.2
MKVALSMPYFESAYELSADALDLVHTRAINGTLSLYSDATTRTVTVLQITLARITSKGYLQHRDSSSLNIVEVTTGPPQGSAKDFRWSESRLALKFPNVHVKIGIKDFRK